MRYDPASFRDPEARVFTAEGKRILRALSTEATEVYEQLCASGLIDELTREGMLVESHRCHDVAVPDGWAAVIESARLPFVSYPYEWSFHMLKDAALLTLDLSERALQHGARLKDASAYNVFFFGARPMFIDVSSFARYQEGMPWSAYGQFCDQFLAPLMLEAYRGVSFQTFLRANLAGLSVTTHLAPLLSYRDLLRSGVLVHVKARAFLDRRAQGMETDARRQLRRASLPKQAVVSNIRRVRRLVAKLENRGGGVWADYDDCNVYDADMVARKSAFVARVGEHLGRGRLAADIGANTGRYSRILARHFDTVVAVDADPGAVDRLYLALRGSGESSSILPLVVDLMNPSPAQGWRNEERQSFGQRGRPELTTYLALIHHVCLGQGVPLADFLEMVRTASDRAIVEFVSAEDPMSQALLATRTDRHESYDLRVFRMLAEQRGRIILDESLSPTRHLFALEFPPSG